MDNIDKYTEKTFEDIKHVNEYGQEYWMARELQPVLEYAQWRRFSDAIERAKLACKNSGFAIEDHFAGVGKMVFDCICRKEQEDIAMAISWEEYKRQRWGDNPPGSNSAKEAITWEEYKAQRQEEENKELLSELAEMWVDYANADVPISDLEETWRNDYTKQELIEDHAKTVTLLRVATYGIDELLVDLESADKKIEKQRTTIADNTRTYETKLDNAYAKIDAMQVTNTILIGLVAAVVVAGVALFFVNRKRKKKRDAATDMVAKTDHENSVDKPEVIKKKTKPSEESKVKTPGADTVIWLGLSYMPMTVAGAYFAELRAGSTIALKAYDLFINLCTGCLVAGIAWLVKYYKRRKGSKQ